MKLSIVVPICNSDYATAHYTGNCIGSIRYFTQDIEHELIVIDNDSKVTLGHMDWSRYADQYVKNETNRGTAAAYNQGFKLATGDYLALVCSDVEVYARWADYMIQDLQDPKLGMIMCTPMYDLPFGRALEAEQREKENLENYLSDFRDGSAFMLTRKVWEEIGDFDENYGYGWGEDIDYLFRLEQAGYQFKTDKRVNSHHIGMASGYALGNQNMIDLNGTMDRNKEYTKTKWGLDEYGNPAFRRESA